MKNKQTVIIVALGIVAIGVIGALAWRGSNEGPGQYDDFAKCLTEKGAKMYGAYWCPHCINQKEDFGKSWQYVTYVECSLPGGQAQTPVCKTAGIEGYPTWEFIDAETQNKTRASGELSFEQLSVYSGCPLAGVT